MEIPAFNDDQAIGESMLEEIRLTAERRLRQIEPLLEEAERLRGVLAVLDGRPSMTGQAPPPALGRSQRARRTPAARDSGTGARAAKGSNKRTILQLVATRPGIKPSEISDLTGMKRTVVASTVSRLKRCGELLDHETGGVCVPPEAPGAPRPSGNVPNVRARSQSGTTTRRSRPRRVASLQRRAA